MRNDTVLVTAPSRCWWLPSISTVLWLVFFLVTNLSVVRVIIVSSDSDPCWHWQEGNWMLEHHAMLRTELFSHTRGGRPIIDLWWLSEIVTALAGNLLGWGGIVLVASVIGATCVWLLHRQLLAEGNDLLLSTVLTLLAAAVCVTHWVARPHLATQLLVLVFAWQLRWFARGRITSRRLLTLLPVLTALWANLHGAFVIAFALIGIYFVGAITSWINATADHRSALFQRAKTFAVLGLLCLLASLLNPNGWRLLVHVLRYMGSPLLMSFAQEYLPPSIHDVSTIPFAIISVVTLLTVVIVRPRLNATDALLLVVWFLLALRMVRNAPLFALIATPILAEHWTAYLRLAPASPFMNRFRSVSANLTSVDRMAGARGLPLVATFVMILLLAKPQILGGAPVLSTELPANRFPVAAVEFLRRSPDAVHGEMFNEYAWGGYFIFAMPERKVFIHPNLEPYGEEVTREFLEVNNVEPGWNEVLKKYNVGWTILPREHRLNYVLAQRADWKLAYSDSVAFIYARIP